MELQELQAFFGYMALINFGMLMFSFFIYQHYRAMGVSFTCTNI